VSSFPLQAVINFINTKTEILRELPMADFQIKKKADVEVRAKLQFIFSEKVYTLS
jgi:hypothetical protein